MERKILLRVVGLAGLLFILYSAGLPLSTVVFFGLFFIALILMRDRLFSLTDKLLAARIPSSKEWHPWARRAFVFLVFLLAYTIAKYVIYWALAAFGFDVQGELMKLSETPQKQG